MLARDRVRGALTGCVSPSCVDDAVLVVSELVGNALWHTGGGPDCLVLEAYRDVVVLWVHDGGGDVDTVRTRTDVGSTADLLAESGRGLLLVEALTARWYVQPTSLGKAVVAMLDLVYCEFGRGERAS
ncbi:ATP-binding protein [Streptomyces apocyni]|uniref:ATP-binding protein n=1 Tax=Streptomyces apocyni TaxID=2654677 RepID=UPI001E380297|nr:ATP-binding protein [Streptomyces apocyni]